jgi:hypothetical protein
MKLIRHFFAVSFAIGVVVALGFAWSASGAAGIVADDGGDRQRGAGGFKLSDISDLAQTLVILTLITAAVVIIDRVRRRYRPARFPARGNRTSI